jgi:hypothetical protein
VLPAGNLCDVEDPTMDITHGDVVHPCVRYIKEGFEGHQWWMVYTPFYAENDKLENPRLCYADAAEGNPPTEWKFYCSIADTPETGYNSDPTLLFKDGMLYVFWREYKTPKAKDYGLNMLTVGCVIHEKKVTYFSKPQLTELSEFTDKEVSPTIISNNNVLRAYAIHANFVPDYILRIPSYLRDIFYNYKIVSLFDALGISDNYRSYGVAIWDSESLDQTFSYTKTIQFENSSKLYQPWHMEVFQDDLNGELYTVVLSRQDYGRICLAISLDGETFQFYKKPLLTTKTTKMIGLYKPSVALVENYFYLFYTVHDNKDYSLHKLYVTSADWNDVKRKMANL